MPATDPGFQCIISSPVCALGPASACTPVVHWSYPLCMHGGRGFCLQGPYLADGPNSSERGRGEAWRSCAGAAPIASRLACPNAPVMLHAGIQLLGHSAVGGAPALAVAGDVGQMGLPQVGAVGSGRWAPSDRGRVSAHTQPIRARPAMAGLQAHARYTCTAEPCTSTMKAEQNVLQHTCLLSFGCMCTHE